MLISYKVENFKSFGEEAELSFIPSKIKDNMEHICDKQGNVPSVLRSSLIYGPNASGKTNLLESIVFARQLILNECNLKEGDLLRVPQSKFINTDTSYFEFIIGLEGKLFQYDFTIKQGKIKQENLFEIVKWANPISRRKYFTIFTREDNQVHICPKGTSEENLISFLRNRVTKDNQLFLNKLMDDNLRQFIQIPLAKQIISVFDWFKKIIYISPLHHFTNWSLIEKEAGLADFFKNFLKEINTGITDIYMKESKVEDPLLLERYKYLGEGEIKNVDGYKIFFQKQGGNLYRKELCSVHDGKSFSMKEESLGTLRALDLLPFLFMIKKESFKNILVLVDEINTSLHPAITRKILSTFLNSTNIVKETQLLATTYDSALLNPKYSKEGEETSLRKDALWFVYKKRNGSSKLFRLNRFKRLDTALDKMFITGELNMEISKY